VLAACALCEFEASGSQTQAKKNLAQAIAVVAQQHGNTPAICRKCYVHPVVLETYLQELRLDIRQQDMGPPAVALPHALRPEEAAVLAFLQQRCA
jgi:DNA topoisomerase-1